MAADSRANVATPTEEEEDEDGVPLPPEKVPVGGRLTHFRHQWQFNTWAHSIVSKGLGWAWTDQPPVFKSFFQEESLVLKEYVQELLDKAVVKRAKSLKFQGRLFCVPKKDSDKERVILDLSYLNLFIQCDKFKMLTVSQIRTLLPRGAVTISIDLTDAYWHVPIARRFSPYLGFRLGNRAYTFRAMPFGLNIAPRVFTKLADTVVQELRSKGILVAAYLDDWIIWAPSPEECSRAAKVVMDFLAELGFRVNLKKSRLTPQSKFEWLGLQWDLNSHTLCLPPK